VNGAARPFERCSKQSRRLATRAISANSQADFHQHVITKTLRGSCANDKKTELQLKWFRYFRGGMRN
jgi:hypothetical protein